MRHEDIPGANQRPSRSSFALSPDGRYIVYVASDGATRQLFRRRFDQQQATSIRGTEGASQPFFSPDSASVGFFVDGELKRVPVAGGEARTIATPESRSSDVWATLPSWTEDGTIPVATEDGIEELPANGGDLVPLTQVERSAGEAGHVYPQMLPARRALLFNVTDQSGIPSEWDIAIDTLDGGDRRIVVENGSHPRYVPSGHIVFARSGSLLAVPFDIVDLEVTGAAVVVVEDVMHAQAGMNTNLNGGAAQYSVSETGTLAYVPGGIYSLPISPLIFVDRSGEAEAVPLRPDLYGWPRFSPVDGTQLLYVVGRIGDWQLRVYDIELGVSRALTTTGNNMMPAWSHDGERVAFARGSDGAIMWKAADGSGAAQPIGAGVSGSPSSWSVDDVLALVAPPEPGEPYGIWTVRVDDGSEPELFVERGTQPDFSPNGEWIAYTSDEVEPGQFQVIVRPFPEAEPVQPIGEGVSPWWSSDGRALYYLTWNEETTEVQVMVVDILETDLVLRPSRPRMLFSGLYEAPQPVRGPDISPQGDRFVMIGRAADTEPVTRIDVVLNWFEELEDRVPAP